MNGTQKLDMSARWLENAKAREIFTDPQKGIEKTEVGAPFKLTAAEFELMKSTLNKLRSAVADILEPLQAALENKQQELHNGGKPSSDDK
ncbi:hypothetical protein COCSUDRAFT_58820 [Coccomyxa subellipsoidea C-169]|uniref:Uncharacterized protein n=1 Tax=Coccomyxa subellipsoidea (strain C-169) TaxID=574566 RepID=I0Z6L0_COCSC|nr:hypothetical protein COCSUDRAFT_58820 [Coccomyxa subellipsoidea C-169]EIE26279.1 hypothetical protein COCSUDRAFT_58820 [Coccomyxa subellipsoidea C-169]|eukprot:XP_005650823.1 hypothetical protein COCSUDRAFT_58820 [Coccomyxa subellipsoidea C-169]